MPIRMLLNNPVEDTWLILHQTSDSITKCEEDAFAKVGIPLQQYFVLNLIKTMKNQPATPTLIAKWADRNPNSITMILNRMEKDGLVERVRDLKDRRTYRLVITAKGEEKYTRAQKTARMLPKKMLSSLSLAEIALFSRILREIREHTFDFRNIKDEIINVTNIKE